MNRSNIQIRKTLEIILIAGILVGILVMAYIGPKPLKERYDKIFHPEKLTLTVEPASIS